jgi:hypothetical protein
MTPLPERKKSPEEIAALRDQLGIPGDASPAPAPAEPGPAAASSAASVDDAAVDVDVPVVEAAPVPIAAPHSLRKSEREPVLHVAPEPPPDSPLPVHRHSDEELAALRRRSVFDTQEHAVHMPVRRAPTVLVIGCYLVAVSPALMIYHSLPILLPAAFVLLALGLGAFLFFLRPYSRHHGAFLGIVCLFVITYGALHYFPHLRHAT